MIKFPGRNADRSPAAGKKFLWRSAMTERPGYRSSLSGTGAIPMRPGMDFEAVKEALGMSPGEEEGLKILIAMGISPACEGSAGIIEMNIFNGFLKSDKLSYRREVGAAGQEIFLHIYVSSIKSVLKDKYDSSTIKWGKPVFKIKLRKSDQLQLGDRWNNADIFRRIVVGKLAERGEIFEPSDVTFNIVRFVKGEGASSLKKMKDSSRVVVAARYLKTIYDDPARMLYALKCLEEFGMEVPLADAVRSALKGNVAVPGKRKFQPHPLSVTGGLLDRAVLEAIKKAKSQTGNASLEEIIDSLGEIAEHQEMRDKGITHEMLVAHLLTVKDLLKQLS